MWQCCQRREDNALGVEVGVEVEEETAQIFVEEASKGYQEEEQEGREVIVIG